MLLTHPQGRRMYVLATICLTTARRYRQAQRNREMSKPQSLTLVDRRPAEQR